MTSDETPERPAVYGTEGQSNGRVDRRQIPSRRALLPEPDLLVQVGARRADDRVHEVSEEPGAAQLLRCVPHGLQRERVTQSPAIASSRRMGHPASGEPLERCDAAARFAELFAAYQELVTDVS